MTLPYHIPRALLGAVLMFLIGVCATPPGTGAQEAPPVAEKAQTLNAIALEGAEDAPVLRATGSSPLTYTMYELFDPLRLVLDVASVAFAPTLRFPLHFAGGPVQKVQGTILSNESPVIGRVEIFLAEERAYTVERDGNDILVKFGAAGPPRTAKTEESVAAATKSGAPAALNPDAPAATTLYDIDVERKDDSLRILLKANGPIKKYRTGSVAKAGGNPDRLYIDVEGVETSELPAQKKIGGAVAQVRVARRGSGVRLVFDSALDRLFESSIVPQSDGLLVTVKGGGTGSQPEVTGEASSPAGIIAGLMEKNAEQAAKAAPRAATKPAAGEEADESSYASFEGYTKQRISVDFYKIDLHNVFRLIGEISGRNIIVDEGVGGSLTLALQDVPWDFALDVILNLKGLSMEERYNTLVISPKNKEFSWPERTTDKIAFKADPVTVKMRIDEGPQPLFEAKGLLSKGQDAEGRKDYKTALDLYEQAFTKWPSNGQLAKKIAALYLVYEGMNAKAVHYAKEALRIDPADDAAALQAAVGSANMDRAEDADAFFAKAVLPAKPASEALTSYAAFAEDKGQYGKALQLLTKHVYLYGDTLDTFIAKGRLHDKMGSPDAAVAEYRAALLSGYPLPKDLEQYIRARIPGGS